VRTQQVSCGPTSPTGRALANLRSTLWRAEQELDGLIVADDRTLTLAARVVLDVDEFERRCLGAVDPDEGLGDLAAFAHAAMGDLLPGWYDDWVTFERERLRQVHLYRLEAVTTALRRAGRSADRGHRRPGHRGARSAARERPPAGDRSPPRPG
jgi:DNA-binding SARP family transcriptional activator